MSSKEYKREIKVKAIKYLGGKCMRCKKKGLPCIFDFHHRDPKEKLFTIADSCKSFDNIKSELDKCDLLCDNCHRILHYLEDKNE